jgi:hypothetical protein
LRITEFERVDEPQQLLHPRRLQRNAEVARAGRE